MVEEAKEQRLEKMLKWCLAITKEFGNGKILWTKDMQSAYERLRRMESGGVVFKGMQGIGKTTLMNEMRTRLSNEKKKAMSVQFDVLNKCLKKDAIESAFNLFDTAGIDDFYYDEFRNTYLDILLTELDMHYKEKLVKFDAENIKKSSSRTWDYEQYARHLEKLENLLSQRNRKRIFMQAYHEFLSSFNYLLIDLPDYAKNSTASINSDIETLQELYKMWNTHGHMVLVLTLQEEIGEFGHFFFGKATVIQLNPLSQDEMLQVFKLNFPDISPLTEDSIKRLAKISRGVMRRFKQYAYLVLCEAKKSNVETITPEFVEATIPFERKLSDMQRELMILYPKSESSRMLVVKILEFVRSRNGVVPQKEVIEEFSDYSGAYIGKVLRDMEGKNYARREKRHDGRKIYYVVILV
jgi:hypothetical protein